MEIGVDFIIRPLDVADVVSNISLGSADFQPLKSFLQNQAMDFHNASIAKSYVAIRLLKNVETGVLEECPKREVLAYISLTASEIDIRNGYTVEDCPYANKYETLPAVKIARLAVDRRCRGGGVGNSLMDYAMAVAVDHISSYVGCRFLITDSKQNAIGFYQKMGFTLLDTEQNKAEENPIMFVDLLSLQ